MKFLTIVFILFLSCNEQKKEVKPKVKGKDQLTEIQVNFLKSASLEFQAYMDTCLEGNYEEMYTYCYKNFLKINNGCSKGSSVLKAAAGTAIGIGAAKMILGK